MHPCLVGDGDDVECAGGGRHHWLSPQLGDHAIPENIVVSRNAQGVYYEVED